MKRIGRMKQMKRAVLAAVLICSASGATGALAGEMPADVAGLMKSRLYAEAAKAAEGAGGKVGAEALADIKALAAVKALVVKGAGSGKRRPVRIKMMGRSMRAMLQSADEETYTVKAMGVEQSKKWSATDDNRFYQIVRQYASEKSAADHMNLARACVALGLAEKADEELRAAIRLDFKLSRAANALSERISGAMAGGGGGTGAESGGGAGGESPGTSSGSVARRGPAARQSGAVQSSGASGRSIPGRKLEAAQGATDPVTVNAGSISFTVTKDSGGLMDRLTWQGSQIARSGGGGARRSFCDAFRASAAGAVAGNVGEIARSKAVVTSIAGGGSSATVSGVYRSAAGETVFVNKMSASGGTLTISQSVSIGFDPKRWRLAALGVAVPFDLAASKHAMITTVPGEKRTEWWKLDYNDDRKPDWQTSDKRSRWPLWRVGGLLVDSKLHYRTWKTNMADTWPLTTDEGVNSPGFVVLQDSRKSVTVRIAKMREEAPKEIMIGMAPGLVTAHFWSPHVAPLDLRGTGTSTKSLAEKLGIYPGAAKTHTVTLTFGPGGKDPKSYR